MRSNPNDKWIAYEYLNGQFSSLQVACKLRTDSLRVWVFAVRR